MNKCRCKTNIICCFYVDHASPSPRDYAEHFIKVNYCPICGEKMEEDNEIRGIE